MVLAWCVVGCGVWASPATATLVRVGGGDMTFELGATSATTTEKMRLMPAGYLGIGTATPTVAVQVVGTVSATAFVGDGSGLTNVVTPSTPVAFMVDKNSGTQTVNNNVWTKLTWNHELLDTHNYFSTFNSRFTPKVAGIYFFSLNTGCSSTASENVCFTGIYKNGTLYAYKTGVTWNYEGYATYTVLNLAVPVPMNGSTDYVEAYGYIQNSAGSSAQYGYADDGDTSTNFSGILIR